MVALVKRQPQDVARWAAFEWLDRAWDDWGRLLPFRAPFEFEPSLELGQFIRVEEYREGDELVVRAELPGVDPERDVSVTVTDHTLHIEAERREEEETEKKGFLRHELRYGRLARSLPLPETVTEGDVSATYADGILRIAVKMPEGAEVATEARRIPVTKG